MGKKYKNQRENVNEDLFGIKKYINNRWENILTTVSVAAVPEECLSAVESNTAFTLRGRILSSTFQS